MSKLDDMGAWAPTQYGKHYYAGGADNNHDGLPDRKGPFVYDCSGFVWALFHHVGINIPDNSATVAQWGRSNGFIVSKREPGCIVIHDKWNDAYNSYGPRGHIGVISNDGTGRTWESASSKHGVGIYPRPWNFWCLTLKVPALYGPGGTVPPAPKKKKGKPMWLVKGSGVKVYVTDGITRRYIATPSEMGAIKWLLALNNLYSEIVFMPDEFLVRIKEVV